MSGQDYLGSPLGARDKFLEYKPERPWIKAVSDLTAGHLGGIYRPYVFISKQIWVQSREHGVPFLTGSTMIRSDLTSVRLLAKRQAMSRTFRPLEIRAGTTLVSCSGNIGRTVFVRPDMDGMWTSLDLMKIIPDASKIRPGYLFAYLAGRFGLPLLTQSTYGAIIQHVDREHLLGLPVPRFGEELERRVHELIEQAAQLRAKAATALIEAGRRVCDLFRFPQRVALASREFGTSSVGARFLQARMDATYFSRAAIASGELLRSAGARDSLEDLGVSVLETGRIKQFFVAESVGVPFLTSGEIFLENYQPERFLSRKRLQGDWAVATEDTLLARSGQVGGFFAIPTLATTS
jgi:type I restriction enzyme S subunit